MNFAKFLVTLLLYNTSGLGFEKYSNYLTALGLELPYWSGIDFVITWIWIEEINQPRQDAIRKV